MTFIQVASRMPIGTKCFLRWPSGKLIEAELDTIGESNNGLDPNDKDYQEYYSAYFIAIRIENPERSNVITPGSLFEVAETDGVEIVELKEKRA